MAMISRKGFGQVEPNHLSYQKTGQMYAQLPAKADIEILENGQFAKYDMATGEVNFTGAGEWLLVFNEVKLYEETDFYKDYAMIKNNYTPGGDVAHYGVGPFKGTMYPRLVKTNIGDLYTTNTVKEANTSKTAIVEGIELVEGNLMAPNTKGFLDKIETAEGKDMVWQVVKVYTMPDGQPAVKLMRIK